MYREKEGGEYDRLLSDSKKIYLIKANPQISASYKKAL
jgi:hypothetical protein